MPVPGRTARVTESFVGRLNATGFVFNGDFGTGRETETDVSSAIRTWVDDRPFDALVTLGDNVYSDGSPSRFDEAWHEPSGWVEDAGVPVVASLGNHDVETANGGPVMDLFDMPNRWYERRVGPVDLFVLDSNDLEAEGQMEWLSTALASLSAPWQILVFHHPVYSCGKHGSTPRVQHELLPVVASQGVDLVVNGHDHNDQRFPPVNGTTYVVSGGGARPLPRRRLPSRHARPGRMERRRSRVPLHLSDPGRTHRNVSASGTVLDTFQPQRSGVTSNLRWSDSPRLGSGRSC